MRFGTTVAAVNPVPVERSRPAQPSLRMKMSDLPSPLKSPPVTRSSAPRCQPPIQLAFFDGSPEIHGFVKPVPVEVSRPAQPPLRIKRSALPSPLKSPTETWSFGPRCQLPTQLEFFDGSPDIQVLTKPVPAEVSSPAQPPLRMNRSALWSPLKSPTNTCSCTPPSQRPTQLAFFDGSPDIHGFVKPVPVEVSSPAQPP